MRAISGIKVLVTDASYIHTLAAIRSLGKKNIYVIAGSSSKYAQSFYSKYCRERVIYPDPQHEEQFVTFMLKYVKEHKIDVLLPIGYLTNTALSKRKDEFSQYTTLPIANWNSMNIACSKNRTIELARKLGIRVPKIYEEVEEIIRFPIVVKGNQESGRIRYVNSLEELSKIDTSDSTLQEYIPGEGYGFFSLFSAGRARAIFMHRRIREYPITGGPSTAAESIYDSELMDLGLKLLKALDWHGVAMVEFKKDLRDGKFKLMEINPKFWGSLDLAIASGVDFPYLTIKLAVEGDVECVSKYSIGTKFRWLFPGDLLHLIAKPSSAGAFIGDFLHKNVKSNILLNDIKPNLFQFFEIFPIIISRIGKGKLKYPHGIPKQRVNEVGKEKIARQVKGSTFYFQLCNSLIQVLYKIAWGTLSLTYRMLRLSIIAAHNITRSSTYRKGPTSVSLVDDVLLKELDNAFGVMKNAKHGNYQMLAPAILNLNPSLSKYSRSRRMDSERYNWFSKKLDFRWKKVADIGGNIGYFSIRLATEMESAVTVYEPFREHSEVIEICREVLHLDRKKFRNERSGVSLSDIHKLEKQDITLLFNVLQHAGEDFDTDLVHNISGWETYAINYLKELKKVTSYLVFQIGYTWLGHEGKLCDDAEILDFTIRLLRQAEWTIIYCGVVENITKPTYVDYVINDIGQNCHPLTNIKPSTLKIHNLLRGSHLDYRFMQRPIFVCGQ